MGGSSNSSPTTNTTTNNAYTTNTTNKNTPVAAKTTTGPAAAGYKSTFNITNKTGGLRAAEAALAANSGALKGAAAFGTEVAGAAQKIGNAAIASNASETNAALGFAQSVGKADLNFLTTAGGQIIGLAGKKIQTATQAATGTTQTTTSKSRDLLIIGALALAGLVAVRAKR